MKSQENVSFDTKLNNIEDQLGEVIPFYKDGIKILFSIIGLIIISFGVLLVIIGSRISVYLLISSVIIIIIGMIIIYRQITKIRRKRIILVSKKNIKISETRGNLEEISRWSVRMIKFPQKCVVCGKESCIVYEERSISINQSVSSSMSKTLQMKLEIPFCDDHFQYLNIFTNKVLFRTTFPFVLITLIFFGISVATNNIYFVIPVIFFGLLVCIAFPVLKVIKIPKEIRRFYRFNNTAVEVLLGIDSPEYAFDNVAIGKIVAELNDLEYKIR